MAKNILITEEPTPEPEKKEESGRKKKQQGNSFLSGLLRKQIRDDLVFRNLPFILFCSLLIFTYIMITNNIEKMLGRIEIINNEIKELRTTRIHYENVFSSVKKQSSVAQRLDSLKTGIREARVQPKFIEVIVDKAE